VLWGSPSRVHGCSGETGRLHLVTTGRFDSICHWLISEPFISLSFSFPRALTSRNTALLLYFRSTADCLPVYLSTCLVSVHLSTCSVLSTCLLSPWERKNLQRKLNHQHQHQQQKTLLFRLSACNSTSRNSMRPSWHKVVNKHTIS
jgi:hypothetical protein